jgi:hypothetical protein
MWKMGACMHLYTDQGFFVCFTGSETDEMGNAETVIADTHERKKWKRIRGK